MKPQVNNMHKYTVTIMIICLAVLISSCTEDCPVCPGPSAPYKGWLFASDWRHKTEQIYKIDIETDSIVDSVSYRPEGAEKNHCTSYIEASDDGRYLVVGYFERYAIDGFTRVYDPQTLEVITDFEPKIDPIFVTDENILIGLSAVHRKLYIYDLPGFSLIWEDSIGHAYDPEVDEKNGLIYLNGCKQPASDDSTFIMVYDYRNRKVVREYFLTDDYGDTYGFRHFDVRSNGESVLFLGFSFYEPYALYEMDLQTGELIDTSMQLYSANGDMKLTPDEEHIYVTDPNWPTQVTFTGTLYILDGDDLSYEHGISLFGYGTDHPLVPIPAYNMIFTPTGEKCYVASGNVANSGGHILVIDTYSQQIVNTIGEEFEHYIGLFTICPKR